MTSASVVETLKKAYPRARVYGLASTGEVVIERGGRKRGRANITVLSQSEALQQAQQHAPSGLAAVSTKTKIEAAVVRSLVQFFEMQQMCWLYLEEENDHVAFDGGHEDISLVPGHAYPTVGAEYEPTHDNTGVPTDAPQEEVVNAKDITELKQEAGRVVRARVIEFKAAALAGTSFCCTWTRTVAKADKAAFARIKADIEEAVENGTFQSSLREIVPTLKVRPGYVYVRV